MIEIKGLELSVAIKEAPYKFRDGVLYKISTLEIIPMVTTTRTR